MIFEDAVAEQQRAYRKTQLKPAITKSRYVVPDEFRQEYPTAEDIEGFPYGLDVVFNPELDWDELWVDSKQGYVMFGGHKPRAAAARGDRCVEVDGGEFPLLRRWSLQLWCWYDRFWWWLGRLFRKRG